MLSRHVISAFQEESNGSPQALRIYGDIQSLAEEEVVFYFRYFEAFFDRSC